MPGSVNRIFDSLQAPQTGFDDEWQHKLNSGEAGQAAVVTVPELTSNLPEYVRLRDLGLCRNLVLLQDGNFVLDGNSIGSGQDECLRLYGINSRKIGKYTRALMAIDDDYSAGKLTFEEYYDAILSAKNEELEKTEWARYLYPRQEEE